MVSGSRRNWIAVNAVQQSGLNKRYDNFTLRKINRPVAFAARFPSTLARVRMLGAFADDSSGNWAGNDGDAKGRPVNNEKRSGVFFVSENRIAWDPRWRALKLSDWRYWLTLGVIAAIYFGAAKFGLS